MQLSQSRLKISPALQYRSMVFWRSLCMATKPIITKRSPLKINFSQLANQPK
ncbi:MAG: hypothetical protein KAF91_14720 [Nostoc sp. TH1S01]|nr:hypothetical protein [Nostoc sp. TH1S01]